jgi:hypothetical protein
LKWPLTDSEILAQSFKLGDAQELVAGQHGFESWQALKTGLPTMSDHAGTISTKAVISLYARRLARSAARVNEDAASPAVSM